MTTYERLDLLADTYTPLLFLGCLLFAILLWRKGDRLASAKGLASIAVAYLLMFIDNLFEIWKNQNLDYSTHSAVAWVLVHFLVHKRPWNNPTTLGLVVSLVLYFALEVYQQYHSVMDIVTTVGVVGSVVVLVYWGIGRLLFLIQKNPRDITTR